MILPTTPERGILEHIREQLAGQGFSNPVITYGDLRLENELSANASTLKFDIIANSSSDRSLEHKLGRGNFFFMTQMALCITKQNKTDNLFANFPLHTYPDRNVYATAAGATGVSEADSLEVLYNSRIAVQKKGLTILDEMLTHNMRYVPEAQFLNPTAPQTGAEVSGYGGTDRQRGYYPLVGSIMLDGDTQTEIILSMGAGDRTLIAGDPDEDESNVAVLLIKGFHVNASSRGNSFC